MDLGALIVAGGMVLFSLFIILGALHRIYEVWISDASLGMSILATLGWLALAGVFFMFLKEVSEGRE